LNIVQDSTLNDHGPGHDATAVEMRHHRIAPSGDRAWIS